MNSHAFTYTRQEEELFQNRTEPTREGYREWKLKEETIGKDSAQTRDKLANATARRKELLAKDPNPLAWALWAELLVLGVLFSAEVFLNYLAALGLLQDDTITWGVTVGLTLIVAALAFGLAREYRHHRSKELVGTVEGAPWPLNLGWAFITLAVCTIAYLVVSLFLRDRYFDQQNIISGLGDFASNPWVIATILTVLSGLFTVAIVYVLSHINRDLARVNAEIKRCNRRLPKLESSHVSAREAIDRAKLELDTAARTSQTTVLLKLGSEGLLEEEETARNITADEVLRHFQNFWRDLVGDARTAPESQKQSQGQPEPAPASKPFPGSNAQEGEGSGTDATGSEGEAEAK